MTAFDPHQEWYTRHDNAAVAADPDSLDWQPVGGRQPVDTSQLKWQPAHAAPDVSKLAWKPQGGEQPQGALQWSIPKPGRPPKWLYGVGPNNVTADFQKTWQQFGKGGVRPQFRDYVNELGNAGYSMGVYDFDLGHHYAPNDPHLDGRAMDVDTINKESVGTKLTPNIGGFIETALGENPHARVGVPKEIYAQLPDSIKPRAFIDDPAHIHVELTPDGMVDTHATPDPWQHTSVDQMRHMAVAGVQIPFNRAVMRAWANKQAQSEANVRTIVSQLQRVPIQGFLDILGAPQRGVGETIGGLEAGHDLPHLLHDFWHGLTDAETSRNATDSVRAIMAHVGGPGGATRQQVREWVNESDVPKALKPYLSAYFNTTADFAAQTISDPLTLAGGLGIWAKGVGLAVKGLGEAGRMLAGIDDLARAAKAGENVGPFTSLFKQVPQTMLHLSAATRSVAGKLGNSLNDSFGIRPDLEDFTKGKPVGKGTQAQTGGLTFTGKQRRIGVENSELKMRNDALASDQAALRSKAPGHNLTRNYLQLAYRHGSQADSDLAARLLGLPKNPAATGWIAGIKGLDGVQATVRDMRTIGQPTSAYDASEAIDALSKGRNRVRLYSTAQRTHEMVQQHPDSLLPGSSPKTAEDWRGVAMDPKRKFRDNDDIWSKYRELSRANVMIFPFAHGIGNVGGLSYLGAPEREGLRTVMDGFRYMAGRATDGKLPGSLVPDEAELTKYGAAQTYVHEHEAPGLWKHLGDNVLGAGLKSHIIRMQTLLSHMETGWRASLWDALKRNPETAKLDPLIRGAMVAQKAGDPRNVAAFVRSFEQFGGPFVAYRLGIVPRAVLEAIRDNPQRVLAAIRPVLDLQDNRTKQAQNDNTFNLNDPVANAARLMGPGMLNYLLSPSTIGLIGLLVQQAHGLEEGDSYLDATLNAFGELNPLGGVVRGLQWAWPGITQDSEYNPMPGQRMSWADKMAGAIMAPIASFYFAKAANEKYQAQMGKRIEKKADKSYQDLIDLLLGGQ